MRRSAGDPLTRLGVRLMGFALLVSGAVAAYALLGSAPPERAAVKSAAEPRAEALVRSDPGFEPRKEPTVAFAGPEVEATTAEPATPEPTTPAPTTPEPGTVEPTTPEPGPPERARPKKRAQPPAPPPEPAPEPQREPQRDPLPVAEADWPEPTREQVERAHRLRSYELPPGALMALTAGSIGLRNAPVLSSETPDALDKGVVHAAETSMPWSDTPERNVYLAGHRIGWPGTGSRLVFYRLDELSRGDEVVLRDRGGKRYGYRVIDSFVVGPGASWVTGRVRGRDLLTLQTCTGPNWSKRLIVRAERV